MCLSIQINIMPQCRNAHAATGVGLLVLLSWYTRCKVRCLRSTLYSNSSQCACSRIVIAYSKLHQTYNISWFIYVLVMFFPFIANHFSDSVIPRRNNTRSGFINYVYPISNSLIASNRILLVFYSMSCIGYNICLTVTEAPNIAQPLSDKIWPNCMFYDTSMNYTSI